MPTLNYYPSPQEILENLGMECILVGSCTKKPIEQCKDIDFVISDKGLDILRQWKWKYFLVWDSDRWACLLPYEPESHKTLEFFNGLCEIVDEQKKQGRITYEEACLLPLSVKTIEGVAVLSLN